MTTSRYARLLLLLAVGVGVVAFVLLKSTASTERGGNGASGPLQVVLFAPPPPVRDLGVVAPGGRVEVPFVLVNEVPEAVTLGEVVTSCACLSVTLESQVVSAGGSVNGTAVVDFSDDPNYRGSLLLTAEAKAAGASARRAFMIRLDVDVR